jgi:hypothetical protein
VKISILARMEQLLKSGRSSVDDNRNPRGTVEGAYALAVIGDDLYAGGTFNSANGVPANYIAKWDGPQWSALGSGMNGGVKALCVIGSDLYAGGYFTQAGGNDAAHLARWDGSQWWPVAAD